MGKGFGVNSKAQEGRERKVAQKEMKRREEQRKNEEKEAQRWLIGAKIKSEKQIQEERKREEKARKKLEKEQLVATEEAEMAKIKPIRSLVKEERVLKNKMEMGSSSTSLKSTKSNASAKKSNEAEASDSLASQLELDHESVPIYSASNIDDALFLLESTSSVNVPNKIVERRPERRIKAAYAAFEERELVRLKTEFPGLRITQLREKLCKLWQKSPENPFNQTYVSYNATKSQEMLKLENDMETNLERLRLSPH